MKLKVTKPFDWAHQGVRVESFAKGQVIETDDEDLIRVSTKEGWTKADNSKASTAANSSEADGTASDTSAPVAGQGDAPAEQPPVDPAAAPAADTAAAQA